MNASAASWCLLYFRYVISSGSRNPSHEATRTAAASRCSAIQRLPNVCGPASSGGRRLVVWFIPCVTISYSVGARPRLPSRLHVRSRRARAPATSSLMAPSCGLEVPDILIGPGRQPAREARHLDLELTQRELAAEV